ncbi:MAG: response regulator transcription factor [Undibacterium sp.]|nr:response regulator transcription factor [Opitutaceae bacterium]
MKILAVEDDPVAQLVPEASLRQLGHEAVLAADGAAAWELLGAARDEIRLVVSDWLMPRLNGLELCSRIRARGPDYIYFILLTQQTPTDVNHEEALTAGVDDFLVKPVNLRELRMRLRVAERILGYTRQVRQLESCLPICSYCKNVRDDQDYRQHIEAYLNKQSGTNFSHGVCPDCYETKVRPILRDAGLDSPPYEEMQRRIE